VKQDQRAVTTIRYLCSIFVKELTMWILVAREAPPDAPEWRHLLAALDALVWPLLWVLLIRGAPPPVGLVGPFLMAVAVLCAIGRLHRAVWLNHRYYFTTWRWGKVVAAMLVLGWVMKLTMPG